MRVARGGDRPVVLVVEDDTLIRLNAVAMIEDAGFEVVEAVNADEAILILENRNNIRIVFTDVHMPGSMDGLTLAHAVRDRWSPIKLIVTSGQMMVPEDELPTGRTLLQQTLSALRACAGVE
jgi:two-component system, response regulator PdtaR